MFSLFWGGPITSSFGKRPLPRTSPRPLPRTSQKVHSPTTYFSGVRTTYSSKVRTTYFPKVRTTYFSKVRTTYFSKVGENWNEKKIEQITDSEKMDDDHAAQARSARWRSRGHRSLALARGGPARPAPAWRSDHLGVLGHALLGHPRAPVDAEPGSQLRDGQAALVLEQVLHVDRPEAPGVVGPSQRGAQTTSVISDTHRSPSVAPRRARKHEREYERRQ